MELNKEYLEKSKVNLEQQYKELYEQMLQVKGALKWVNQALKRLG